MPAAPALASSFGRLLRRFREAAGLTQEALAERAGLTPEAISLLERGDRRRPHADTLHRLANALSLSSAQRTALSAAARPAGTPRVARVATPLPGLLAPLTTLVGREQEMVTLTAMLRSPGLRLLTLTGPGGVGKTHLAMEVAQAVCGEYADGLAVVSLAPIVDHTLVVAALAQSVGIVSGAGQSLRESLPAYLQDKQMLMVLDNFEHVTAAAPAMAEILVACPALTLLVTSRTPLHVRGEQLFHVQPLPAGVPETDPATLAATAAVVLFAQRARAADGCFALTPELAPIIAAICERLDGLPLAIELAAARVRSLPPRTLLPRLDRRLPLLTGGGPDLPARHQALRHAIAWSYDLLNAVEQRLFRRLCVFAGGGQLDAVEAVCAADGDADPSFLDALRALVDANLVRMADRGAAEVRVELLETIREYGRDQLAASGEQIAVETRHARYYLDLAEIAEPELRGPDQVRWLDRLEAEHDNLRAILQWALAESADQIAPPLADAMRHGDRTTRGTLGLCLGSALGQFWFRRGHLEEGQRWLVALLEAVPAGDEPAWSALRARALKAVGVLTFHYSEPEQAQWFFAEALALDEASGDVRARAESLLHVGSWPSGPERVARSATCLPAALHLWQELGDTQGVAETLMQLGYLAQVRADEERLTTLEDRARARAYYEQSLALFRDTGDLWNVADTLWLLGQVVEVVDEARAGALYEESLAVGRAIGSKRGVGIALGLLAGLAERRGDLERAIALHEESLPLRRAAGDRFGLATSLAGLAHAAQLRGEHARAARLLEETRALWHALRNEGWVVVVVFLQGDVAYQQGLAVEAAARFAEALAMLRTLDWRLPCAEAAALACLAAARWGAGDHAGARSAEAESLTILDGLEAGDAGAQAWADASGSVLLIHAFTYLGDLALAEGDALVAAARYARGLASAAGPQDGLPAVAHDLVIGLAEGLGLALAASEPEQAAALLGASVTWRGAHGVALPAIRRPAVDEALQTLRHNLGATAFSAAWDHGSAWSVEQLLDSAARRGAEVC